MTVLALLFILSAIGVSETVYLIRARYAMEKPVCLIGGDCNAVLSSKYNRLFIIHNDMLGLGFYLLSCVTIAFLLLGFGDEKLVAYILEGIVSAASVMSFVLVLIQWCIIKEWCFWCLISAMITWIMAIILILHTSYMI